MLCVCVVCVYVCVCVCVCVDVRRGAPRKFDNSKCVIKIKI